MAKDNKSGAQMPQLAYRNLRFLESADARALRIISEYFDPQARLREANAQHTVVFFGSARILSREAAFQNLREVELRSKGSPAAALQADLKRARMGVHMSRYYEAARELSRLITAWAMKLNKSPRFLMVCSGGGPGIMEAANRGASEAGGKSIGLNIKLPLEQKPNPYIPPELSMMFRYFFMRKLWFAQPAQALIVFPGGFGTMDEMWEFLTLIQTKKMGHEVTILLYGSKFWKAAINFGWLVETGTVNKNDLKLIRFVDSPQQAFEILKDELGGRFSLRPAIKHPFV
ncbi:MAG: LOG family protein [Terriglobia bacterium]|jgi:uncharacterized protein (TIGR00730 family)